MLNKEKFAKEIVEIALQKKAIAFNKTTNTIGDCDSICCTVCLFSSRFNGGRYCEKTRLIWGNSEYSEYTEPKKFTKKEKKFVESCKNLKWFARDTDGELFGYKDKPNRENGEWLTEDCTFVSIKRLNNELKFESIKFSDENPTSRDEILAGQERIYDVK